MTSIAKSKVLKLHLSMQLDQQVQVTTRNNSMTSTILSIHISEYKRKYLVTGSL